MSEQSTVNAHFVRHSFSHCCKPEISISGEAVGVGSVAGGGRYDDLVGMFAAKGRKVTLKNFWQAGQAVPSARILGGLDIGHRG